MKALDDHMLIKGKTLIQVYEQLGGHSMTIQAPMYSQKRLYMYKQGYCTWVVLLYFVIHSSVIQITPVIYHLSV